MTNIGTTYGEALYSLCMEEGLTAEVLPQLQGVLRIFQENPEYVRLLSSPAIAKQERCGLLDTAFGKQLHIYVLNFLKVLTESSNIRDFESCYQHYLHRYQQDNGILPVTAVTAIALTQLQCRKLTNKLEAVTGKTIELQNPVDPSVLGGIRLDFDGKRLDDTIVHRLESIRALLQNTVL